MNFKIIRNDGLDDNLTTHEFINYEDAYDFLEREIGSLCCSDADFNEDRYYQIIKI